MNISELEQDFIYFVSKAGATQGLDSFMMKLFAISYISTDDISLDELSKKTGYSLASISNKMKLLESIGLIKKIRKPKSKKIYIKIEKNILKLHRDLLITKEATTIKIAKELLPSIISKHKSKKITKDEKNKLKVIEEYQKQILIVEKVIKKIIKEFDKALKEYEK